jgi:hypothetical protein
MSGETDSTAELLKTSIGRIIANIGTVLAHTQEALLKDVLADMQRYWPAAENHSYEAFKASLKPGENSLKASFADWAMSSPHSSKTKSWPTTSAPSSPQRFL